MRFCKYIPTFLTVVIGSLALYQLNKTGFDIETNRDRSEESGRPQRSKKKIIIFMCRGGSAHTCGANAMKEYLGDAYDVHIVNILTDVLGPLDPVRRLTFKKYSGEDVYNYFLSHEWTGAVNKLAEYGAKRFTKQRKKIIKLIDRYIEEEVPDLIISDIMYVNSSILPVAEKYNIPFITVCLDFDMTMWIHGFKKPEYKHYRHTFIVDDAAVTKTAEPAGFSETQKIVSGFPIRPQFFEQKDKEAIKKDFSIPNDKPVIMVMMGGAGSKASYSYAKSLANITSPKHIIVCLGRNEQLKKKIEGIKFSDDTTITVLGFTNRVSDLMAVSDLLITKPGPSSIVEALTMKLPMLLDATHKNLRWEQFNINFVKEKGLGDIVYNIKDLEALLEKNLNNKENHKLLKQHLANFKINHFEKIFLSLVQEMLAIQ